MKHWSVDEQKFRATNPEKYRIWKLAERVNVGVGPRKIKRAELKKYWPKLDLDPTMKQYLSNLLWPKRS